jgi:hypothetical protein
MMVHRRHLVLGFVGMAVLSLGCAKLRAGAAADAGAEAGPAASASGATRGLERPENDAEIIKLAKAAVSCPRDQPDAHFRAMLDPDCPSLKTWEKSDRIAQSPDATTLLNLIEDPFPINRWLGATALTRISARWKKDKQAATRIVTATEKEDDKFVGYRIGLATAVIDLKATGLADRVIALINDEKRDPWLRDGVVATLGYNDPEEFPAVREAVEQVARRDKDASLRGSAVRELGHAAAKECTLFLELLHDPESAVASSAVHACFSKGCEANIEPMLVEIERQAKLGQVKNETFAWALGEVGKSSPPPKPAMKSRLMSDAREIVKSDKNSSLARSRAIEVMVALDPKAAAAFAAKYTKDSDALVAAAAKKAAPPAN